MVYVIKANGEKAPFEKERIVKTCKRSGVPNDIARSIADEVASKVYEGMQTSEILDMVLERLKKYEAHHYHKYQLKEAIAALEPNFNEFEKYTEHLLRALGYKTKWNLIIKGECVEHQIDVLAEKDGVAYMVECKHHINPHRWCGLGTMLQTWAAFDDIYQGKNERNLQAVWLVTNTKFSAHAVRYGTAKKMIMTGWNYPAKQSLRDMIEKGSLYPITVLHTEKEGREEFSNAGILLLQELVDNSISDLHRRTGISEKELELLTEKAVKIIKS